MPCRILYVHGVTAIGGAERDLLATVRRLDRRIWEPIVACPERGVLVDMLEAQGVDMRAVTLAPWRKLPGFFRRWSSTARLLDVVWAVKPDLVHVNDLYWMPYGAKVKRKTGIPVLVTVRQNLQARKVRQYQLERADRTIVLSRMARIMLEREGLDRQNVSVIPSGIDERYFDTGFDRGLLREEWGLPRDALVLGSVGNVLEVKGYDILLKALAEVTRQEGSSELIIVGRDDSHYARELYGLAKQLHLDKRVHWLGFQEDVRPFLAMMDVMVLASRAEALGVALLEAMAMGRPVVAARVGGIPEAVEDGRTGILVPPEDPSALAEACLHLLRHPDQRVRMGEAGRKRVEEQFSLDRTMAALHQVYDRVMSDSSHTCL